MFTNLICQVVQKKIVITGGAGFIGSHLVDELIENDYKVVVFDNLIEQVHGPEQKRPDYLNEEAELVVGDVRDKKLLQQVLKDAYGVFHFAARVGVGQSMYEIREYMDVNNIGTSVLMEALIDQPVTKLIMASSMSIYGEGLYRNNDGQIVSYNGRSQKQYKLGNWEPTDEQGNILTPLPTPETKAPSLASVYALSKYDQECLSLICGEAYHIPTTALRFFNVYGSRQSLSNPYTGVLAIFASRYLNNKPPLIFEDGLQKRDFVHVKDVARASRLALETPESANEVFNIGSGISYTVNDIAMKMSKALNIENIKPKICGEYRVGDIRHCFADVTKAEKILGYQPLISFEEGMDELVGWLAGEVAVDSVEKAREELTLRGLTI